MSTFSNITNQSIYDTYDSSILGTGTISIHNPGSVTTGITNQIYTTTNTGPLWDNISINATNTPRSLEVVGDANFEGDLKIKGKSLSKTLEEIEKRLAILHPNKELEEKWERLKSLGDMYRELEQEIIEKEKVYQILKNT